MNFARKSYINSAEEKLNLILDVPFWGTSLRFPLDTVFEVILPPQIFFFSLVSLTNFFTTLKIIIFTCLYPFRFT